MIRFTTAEQPPIEPIAGTVTIGATGVVLPGAHHVHDCTPPPGFEGQPLEAVEARVLDARLRGETMVAIGKSLKISRHRVRTLLRRCRERGLLKDVEGMLAHDAVPLAVERLTEKLDHGDWPAIHATLKGVGLFRAYTQKQSDTTSRNLDLSVTFTLPTDRPPLDPQPQNILGRPRETRHAAREDLDAEGRSADSP